jgi:hypothetical protein
MSDMLRDRLLIFFANHWRANEADLLFCDKVGKPMVRKVSLKLQKKIARHRLRHDRGFSISPAS